MQAFNAPVPHATSRFLHRSLLLVAALMACGGSGSDAVAPVNPAAIAITPNSPAVALGAQVALQAQVHDASGLLVAGASVFWSSSDTTVAVVSSTGVVTGRNLGTAQIAASSGGQSAVVPLQVVPVPVASVTVLPSSATVTVGGTVALQIVVYDSAGHTLSGRPVVWATSSAQVARVDSAGTVTGVAAGSATITGTVEGRTASSSVSVAVVPVAAVTVAPGSASLTTGQATSLVATATDANGNVLSGRQFTWSSANTSVGTVSAQGLVTATGAGSTTISATSEGRSGSAQIAVTSPTPTPVASVSVSPSAANVTVGATVTLSANVRDANGATLSGRTVTWSSSATQTATVSSSGVVTGVSPGNATITATSEGKSGTSVVTVQQPAPTPVASVRVTPSTLALSQNQSGTLTAQVLDANGRTLTGRTVTWVSSNANRVSVTPSGSTATVTASDHDATVTITATSGGVNGTATVTVQHN